MDPGLLPNTFVAGFGGEDIPKDVQADEREERRTESVRRWLVEVSQGLELFLLLCFMRDCVPPCDRRDGLSGGVRTGNSFLLLLPCSSFS